MNIEQPDYVNRTFYGPLELSKEVAQNGDRYISLHPDDPTKLIRSSGKGVFYNHHEMNEIVFATQKVIEGLTEHGVNHVNPQYIDQTTELDDPHLMIVVDRLQDVTPYDELRKRGTFTDEQLIEIDYALCGMLDFTLQAIQEEGYISAEMMHLKQFVYDESQPPGKKMVLVDVEPLDGQKIDTRIDSMKYGYPSQLAYTAVQLAIGAIVNTNRAGWAFASIQKAAEVVTNLPGESMDTIKAQTYLLHALYSKTITKGILDLVRFDEDDGDDWIIH
jgi:hypothetical protein